VPNMNLGTKRQREKEWRQTQLGYDDTKFLAERAGRLDLLRWDLLEDKVVRILAGQRGMLLDAGAGDGRFAAKAPPPLAYFSLEPSWAMIAKAESTVLPRLVRGRNEEMPFRAAAFSCVLIKETLDHCFDPARVLAEALRVLKPGGKLIVTAHSSRAYYRLAFGWLKADDREHLYHFYPRRLERLLSEAGYRQVKASCHNYLRLPKVIENLLCSVLGQGLSRLLIRSTDRIGRLLLPHGGGGVMVTARKPD